MIDPSSPHYKHVRTAFVLVFVLVVGSGLRWTWSKIKDMEPIRSYLYEKRVEKRDNKGDDDFKGHELLQEILSQIQEEADRYDINVRMRHLQEEVNDTLGSFPVKSPDDVGHRWLELPEPEIDQLAPYEMDQKGHAYRWRKYGETKWRYDKKAPKKSDVVEEMWLRGPHPIDTDYARKYPRGYMSLESYYVKGGWSDFIGR